MKFASTLNSHKFLQGFFSTSLLQFELLSQFQDSTYNVRHNSSIYTTAAFNLRKNKNRPISGRFLTHLQTALHCTKQMMKLETNAPLPLLQEEVRTVVEPSLVAKAALIKRWATTTSWVVVVVPRCMDGLKPKAAWRFPFSLSLICSVFSYCQGMRVVTPLQNRTVAEVEQGREAEDWSFVNSIFSSFYLWVQSTTQTSSLAHSLHSVLSVVERPRCLRFVLQWILDEGRLKGD